LEYFGRRLLEQSSELLTDFKGRLDRAESDAMVLFYEFGVPSAEPSEKGDHPNDPPIPDSVVELGTQWVEKVRAGVLETFSLEPSSSSRTLN